MFNKKSNTKKIKNIIAVLCCAIFALSCAGVFANFINFNGKNSSEVVLPEEDSGVRYESLSLRWDSGYPTANDIVHASSTTYTINYVKAGETVTADNFVFAGDSNITITFGSSSITLVQGSSASVTITPANGYKFTSFKYTTSGTLTTTNHELTEDGTTKEVNPQDMDPSYSGQLNFSLGIKAREFDVNLYYETEEGYSCVEARTYSIEESLSLGSYSPTEAPDGSTVGWWFSKNAANAAGLSLDTTTTSGKLVAKTSTSGNQFEFDVETTKELGTDTLYKITHIKGYNDFDTFQSDTAPIIIARYERKYNFTIKNEGKDASGNSTLWANSEESKVSDKKDLIGVYTGTQPSDVQIKTTINDVYASLSTAPKLYDNESYVFTKGNKFTNEHLGTYGYAIFNYGHRISGYRITYIEGGSNKYVSIASGALSTFDSAATTNYVGIDNADGETFSKIAGYLDELDFNNGPTHIDGSVTIEAVWTPVEVRLLPDGTEGYYNDDDTTVKTVTFGVDKYNMDYSGAEKDGQSIIAYKVGENKISNSGVWNYYKNDITYTHSGGEAYYSLSLDPVYVNNIYKVALNEVEAENKDNNIYKLHKDSWATDNSITEDHYTFENFPDISVYDFDEYSTGFMDDYTTTLNQNIINWNKGVGAVTGTLFNMLSKVYYSTGTLNTSNNVLTATSPTFHTYFAHNQAVSTSTLPVFGGDYSCSIAWKLGSSYYLTEHDITNASNELSSLSPSTIYEYAATRTALTAIKMYQFDLYYEDDTRSDGVYSSIKSGWYGVNTTLTLPTSLPTSLPTKIAEGKTFVAWISDGNEVESDAYNGYSYAETPDNKLTIGSSIYVTINTGVSHPDENVYDVTHVKGTGRFYQNAEKPLIKARFKSTYKVHIENTITNSTGFDWDDYSSSIDDVRQMYGAYGSETLTSGYTLGKDVLLDIKDEEGYNYAFMSSEGKSFMKLNDWAPGSGSGNYSSTQAVTEGSNWYYLFNYGHYISGWIAEFENESVKCYFNGSGFVGLVNTKFTPNTINMGDMAAAADLFFAPYSSTPTVELKPIWTPVEVELLPGGPDGDGYYNVDDTTATTVTFGVDKYNMGYYGTPSDSYQSVIAYQTNSNRLISNSGVWNYYKEVTSGDFICESVNTYSVQLSLYCINNIYKVTLKNVKSSNGGQEYKLSTGSWATDNSLTKACYTFKDSTAVDYTYDQYSSGLMDNYTTKLNENIERWNEGINNDGSSDFGLLSKAYYSTGTLSDDTLTATSSTSPTFHTYLAHNQTYSNLPGFNNDEQNMRTIYWYNTKSYCLTSSYDAKYSAELPSSTESSNVFTAEETTLDPYYIYSVDLYYESKENCYVSTEAAWYGPNTALPISTVDASNNVTNHYTVDNNKKKEGYIFKNWMVNLEQAEDDGYNIDKSTSGQVGLKKDGKTTTISYYKTNEYNSNLVYLSSISGYLLVQNSTKPIISALWYKQYTVIIDNSSTYWSALYESAEDKTVFDGLIDDLYGAVYSLSDENGSSKIVQFDDLTANPSRTDGKADDYVFQNSMIGGISSFVKGTTKANAHGAKNSEEAYYYVYNYGHYISGWKISILDARGNMKYVAHDATTGKWKISGAEQSTIIERFTDFKFNDVAYLADDVFATEIGDYTITFTPCWKPAKIKIEYDSTAKDYNNNTFDPITGKTFGEEITLNSGAKEDGKELFAYYYDSSNKDGSLLSLGTIKWNYTGLANKETGGYVYDNSVAYGKGVHTLTIYPVFLNNIYEVKLLGEEGGALQKTGNNYRISGGGYQFSTEEGYPKKVNDLSNTITYANYNNTTTPNDGVSDPEYTTYTPYNNETLVDTYINNLETYKSKWEEFTQIDGSNDFRILKTIYYTTGNVTCSSSSHPLTSDGTTITLCDSCENLPIFHIYLVHSQSYPNLPVIDTSENALIFWENANNIPSTEENYVYKTIRFDDYSEDHASEINGKATHKDDAAGKWFITDGGTAGDFALKANYFRKKFILNIQTILKTTGDNARVGYVHLDITDTLVSSGVGNKNGDYVVAYDGSNMVVYSIIPEKTHTPTTLSNYIDPYNSDNNEIVSELYLYAGCSMNLYFIDQSKDTEAVNSGKNDSMIGYRFDSATATDNDSNSFITGSDPKIKANFSLTDPADNYIQTVPSDFAETVTYRNTTEFEIKVFYAPIKYNLNIEIDDEAAGNFDAARKGLVVAASSSKHQFVGLMADDALMAVNFKANIGYDFENDAFKFYSPTSSSHTLQTKGDPINQIYSFDFGGTWLRENYYNKYDKAYSTSDLTGTGGAGTIRIQTQSYKFKWGLKLYDSDYPNDGGIFKTIDGKGVFQLSNGKYTLRNVLSSNIIKDSDGLNIYHYPYTDDAGNEIKYALISSKLYDFNNPASEDVYATQYKKHNFLLTTSTDDFNRTFDLTTSVLVGKINNYSNGKIVASEDRKIYITLELKPIHTITVNSKFSASEPSLSQVDLRVSNGDGNIETRTIAYGSTTNDSLSIYTHKGLRTTIRYTFKEKTKYEKIKYGSNEIKINDGVAEFTNICESDKTYDIMFIENGLKVEFKYFNADGNSVDKSNFVGEYIQEIAAPVTTGAYSVGEHLTYTIRTIEENAADYNIEIVVKTNKVSTDNVNRQITFEYTTLEEDFGYNDGIITFNVKLIKKLVGAINASFVLDSNSATYGGENYGTIKIFNGSEEATDGKITSGRQAIVQLELQKGYELHGYYLASGDVTTASLDADNKLVLADSFDPAFHAGNYYIVVKKIRYRAELEIPDDAVGQYRLSATSEIQVGQTISLITNEVPTERLDYFYYVKRDGDIEKISSKEQVITSDLLESIDGGTIKFGVTIIKKYKLSLEIIGEEYYCDSYELLNGSDVYNEDTYCDKDTVITLKVNAKLSSKGVGDKYNIKLTINGTTIKTATELNEDIQLTEDKNVVVEFIPKTFAVNVVETFKSTVAGRDETVTTDFKNGIEETDKSQQYDGYADIEINRSIVNDREISTITIEGNDLVEWYGVTSIKFVFKNDGTTDYQIVDNDNNPISLDDDDYKISFSGNKVVLRFHVQNNITLTLNYKAYKTIST